MFVKWYFQFIHTPILMEISPNPLETSVKVSPTESNNLVSFTISKMNAANQSFPSNNAFYSRDGKV